MAPVDLKRVAALFGAAGAYDVEAERLRAQGADPLPYVVLAARARAKLRDEFGIDTASAEAAAAEAAVRAEVHADSVRAACEAVEQARVDGLAAAIGGMVDAHVVGRAEEAS